jgi:hypothetical protein
MKTLSVMFSALVVCCLSGVAVAGTEEECRDAGKASGKLFAEQYTKVLLNRYSGQHQPQETYTRQGHESDCGEELTKACRSAMWEYLYFNGGEASTLVHSDWQGAFSSWHTILYERCAVTSDESLDRVACPLDSEEVGGKFCKVGSKYLISSDGEFWEVKNLVYEYGAPSAYYMVEFWDGSGNPGAARVLPYRDLGDVEVVIK